MVFSFHNSKFQTKRKKAGAQALNARPQLCYVITEKNASSPPKPQTMIETILNDVQFNFQRNSKYIYFARIHMFQTN